ELNLEPSELFDLSLLAEELSSALAQGFQSERQVILVSRTDTACPVLGQKPRIAQIIDNLLTNAVSFTPSGGRVFLTTQRRNDEVLLLIADEGPGLAADTQEKIFDRFYTDRSDQPLENSQSVAGFGHSGLGLSISRQIARAHGGDLIAENRPDGTGAYFTLSLPLAETPSRRKRTKEVEKR
ncbi:MAG TPA: hypothetical protein DCS39_02730, partial [Rhodobiaceae bacterium]|nr:hypothetical protein [Rhodobiaceae bacterium]